MKAIIKSFSIFKLFGTNDLHIPFEENVKILIGENGLGKTQVLNLLYYILSRNFFRLSEFNFERIQLEFINGTIDIYKKDIDFLTGDFLKHPSVKDFIKEFGYNQFEVVRNRYVHYNGKIGMLEREFESKTRRTYVYHKLFRAFEDLDIGGKSLFNDDFNSLSEVIIKNLNGNEIMYFPTYRRVEEDLHNLGYDDDLDLNEDNTLIQFGMNDVQRRFNQIQDSIDQLLKEGLAQFTKDILNVVIDESQPLDSLGVLDKINEEDINIILSRVGNLLPISQKEAVKNIVANKQYKNPLTAYLLQKLSDIYEKQKELDNAVKIFRDICNTYLIDKEIFYDESLIKIYVKSNITDNEISLSKLSSGEKQIISIFSKLYLSDNYKRFIVLFDEPELSLSMLWQRQLLPDIINSNKCNFLLGVTHSPFVFDNDLDKYAVGLTEYISRSKEIFIQRN